MCDCCCVATLHCISRVCGYPALHITCGCVCCPSLPSCCRCINTISLLYNSPSTHSQAAVAGFWDGWRGGGPVPSTGGAGRPRSPSLLVISDAAAVAAARVLVSHHVAAGAVAGHRHPTPCYHQGGGGAGSVMLAGGGATRSAAAVVRCGAVQGKTVALHGAVWRYGPVHPAAVSSQGRGVSP